MENKPARWLVVSLGKVACCVLGQGTLRDASVFIWQTDRISVLHQITIVKLLTQNTGVGYPPITSNLNGVTLGYPSMAVHLLGVGLPDIHELFEMGSHLSSSQISIKLTT